MASKKTSNQVDQLNLSFTVKEYLQCGYRIYDFEKADNKWKCVFCLFIIKEPIQFKDCGHKCCKGCFESRAEVAIDGAMVCPVGECQTKFHKSQIMPDRAFKRELDSLQVICFHKADKNCSWAGALKLYQEHLDKHHGYLQCDTCEFQFSSIQALADHQATNCEGLFQKCELGSICGEEMIRRDQYDAHFMTPKHQEAIASILIGKHSISGTSGQGQTMDLTPPDNGLEQQTSENLSYLADKVQKLNDETVQLSRDFVRLNKRCQEAVQEVNHFQTANNERNIIISNLQPKQEVIQKEIEQLKQNLEENQDVSTDGTLTWRVDRVAERMADAQSERQMSIDSPIFYSSATGYKMRARVYLYGDWNARRTHMSMFLLLMRGEYDALLQWPFSNKVTFCLFDQTGNNRHIIHSFRPDINSNFFERPKTDANVASGIPKFFPLPMIPQDDNPYIREDTLFLKTVVDFNDTPEMILPYMLTLNPGLPNYVQQILINQEKAERQQQQ